MSEKQRVAYYLATDKKLSDRKAAKHLGMSPSTFGALRRRGEANVQFLKRLVASTNGDPDMVDQYLRHTVIAKSSAA